MKRVILLSFITIIGLAMELRAQGSYKLEIEQEVDGTDLMMDIYIQRTGGTDFALSSCNFAVFIDTASLDVRSITKVDAEDGPWDNNNMPISYLDMMMGKGQNFINLSTRRNTSGSIVGHLVTDTRTKIGRIKIPIKNACGMNTAKWNSVPAAQNMMPLINIKNYATFVDPPADFPLCTAPAIPSLENLDSLNEICEGESVTLSTDASADIQWYKDGVAIVGANDTSFNVMESGQYTVQAINCTACTKLSLTTETIVVKPLPVKPGIEQVGSLLITDATENLQWYRDGVAIPGATSGSYEPTSDGSYSVKTSNSCGEEESDALSIEFTGVQEIFSFELTAFPNPFKGNTVISYNLPSSELVVIELFDGVGRKLATLKNETMSAGEHNLNFDTEKEGYSEGIYYLKLNYGDVSKTLKLVEFK